LPDIKLTIGVPTAGRVCMGFAYSLVGMVSKLAAHGLPTVPEATVECTMDVVESSVIHTNREKIVARAIENGRTHLMFLDDDMVFEPQVLEIMLGRRQHVVAVNYLIKSESDPQFVAVGLDGKRVATKEKSTGIVPIAYTGFGISVFDLDVFKKVPQPWFQPQFVPDRCEYTTEDNPCYAKIREHGFNVYLDHDASKLVRHIGAHAWVWDQQGK
jgi:hypothetical protein